jgi:hypothetical protein
MKLNPILLDTLNSPGRILKRIESSSGDAKDEAWLQDLIFMHPELLPASQFDESLSQVIPLAREVGTNAGSIDNLYITPEGRLIIVETKLWKNPEKHRTVVAQIIDYAKEVSVWSYDDLDRAVLRARRSSDSGNGQGVDEIIRAHLVPAGLSSSEFQERVINNMHAGRFLLLIVGDKISPNVALLSAAIHGVPGLEFQLGLVEMRMHPLNEGMEWPMIVATDVVGRTIEETRAVVKVQYKQERPAIQVDVISEKKKSTSRSKASVETVQEEMPEDIFTIFESWVREWPKRGHVLFWGSRGMTFRASIGGSLVTILEIYPDTISVIKRNEPIIHSPGSYEIYYDGIKAVPKAIDCIAEDRKYVKLEDLSAEEFSDMITTSLEFGHELSYVSNPQPSNKE